MRTGSSSPTPANRDAARRVWGLVPALAFLASAACGAQVERFAMAFEQGSPIVDCVDLALGELKADGTLDALRREWLADGTDAATIEA